MEEQQVKEIANRLKEFLRYNKILRDKYNLMLLYSLPYDEPLQTLAEAECVKKLMPNVKLIPLKESNSIFAQIPDTEDKASMKAYFDSMKAMIEWSKTDKRFLEAMTRAGLLCLLYEQIRSLISMHYGHVIDPLLALEEKLYAPKPVDRNAYAEKIIETMDFYRQPKVPWSEEKDAAYSLLDFMEEEAEALQCQDLIELREKVLAMSLTDDSPEIVHIRKAYRGPFTADMFKRLFQSEGYIRAFELNHMYAILDELAENWEREKIREVLNEEDKIFTMPIPWLANFMHQMEQKYLETDGNAE